MNTPRSIRVNLRFGPRTSPELMKLMASLPPYKRARRLRQLLEQAITHGTDAGKSTRKMQRPAYLSIGRIENVADEEDDAQLTSDVLDLLGQSIRF